MALLPTANCAAVATLCALIFTAVESVRRLPNEVKPDQPWHDHGRRLTSDIDDQDSSQFSRSTASNDPDSHLVTSLPLLPDGSLTTKHWAGHIPASADGDKKIFYWLFEPSSGAQSDDTPLILWLNGGPGCSSMDGLWLENGPLRLKVKGDSWTIDINEYSWHNAPAWTLYVDQPVGTGLSFTKGRNYCKNDFEVNRDFHYFLEEFFIFHSDKFLKHIDATDDSPATSTIRRPFYFSGESHAGHYIPSMMDFILKRNDGVIIPDSSNRLPQLRVHMPLSGAAIGNGWTDPYYQYSAADAAYGAGIIGISQRSSLEAKEKICQQQLKSGSYSNSICFQLLDIVIANSHGNRGHNIVSTYDNRLWEKRGQSRSFPLGHKDVETFLGGATSQSSPPLEIDYKQVLKAIHASESIDASQTYRECTDPPWNALQDQDGLGVVDELVSILDHESKPHILFFNGMNDLICNHVGNEKFLDALPWSRKEQYLLQPRHAWDSGLDSSIKNNYSEGRPDGYIKQYENLSFLKIHESGHMVPMDQPSIAFVMIRILVGSTGLTREEFLSSRQDLDTSKNNDGMCALDECPECKPQLIFEDLSEMSTDTNPIHFTDVGMLIGAFALGISIACVYHCKRMKSLNNQRQIVANFSNESDLELSDVNSYSDKVDNAEYT